MTLPEGWALARVDELTGVDGLTSDGDWVESKDQDPAGEVRLTQLADVGEGDFRDRSARFMTKQSADRLRCTYLQPGDVLIARMPDPIGRACQFPGLAQPAVTAVDVMIWRSDGSIADPAWFVRWVNSPSVRQLMSDGAGGTTRQRIAGGRIKELELPLPPLAEQRRIVAKLDAACARLARARAELDRVPVLAAKLRQSALTEAFEALQEAPTAGLKGLTSKIGSGSTPRGGKAVYVDDGVPFIRSQNVYFEGFDYDGLARITDRAAKALSGVEVNANDVLLNITGASIGRACIVPTELIGARVSQHVAIIRPMQKLLPEFLLAFLQTPSIQDWVWNANYGVTRQALTKGMIEGIQVPLPPVDKQRELVQRLESAFTRADRLEAEAARARALLDRLEAALLARAFRGELVPQDPADEPAQALLDRIRARREAAPRARRGRQPLAR